MVVPLLIVTTLLWGAIPIFEKTGLAKVDPLIGVIVRSEEGTTLHRVIGMARIVSGIWPVK